MSIIYFSAYFWMDCFLWKKHYQEYAESENDLKIWQDNILEILYNYHSVMHNNFVGFHILIQYEGILINFDELKFLSPIIHPTIFAKKGEGTFNKSVH